jgi:3-hydroxybutyryl-CoA dehydrogenase
MNVLVRGNPDQIHEFTDRFVHLSFDTDIEYQVNEGLDVYQVIFDFYLDDSPDTLEMYQNYHGILFVNCVKASLAEYSSFVSHQLECSLVGFNGLPTFFNREVLECTALDEKGRSGLKAAAGFLDIDYVEVGDRVGMVTPRVVCMIINEAYYTVLEGTAAKEDIDFAMKLGTNYPYGPFEWLEKIGILHVYDLLDALYHDTQDERYKICPLLKREYLLHS